MSDKSTEVRLRAVETKLSSFEEIADLPFRSASDGTERMVVDFGGENFQMDVATFLTRGAIVIDGDYTVTEKDKNKAIYLKGATRTLTLPNDLGWANLDKIVVMFENTGFSFDDTAITDRKPQAIQDVAKSLITIRKLDRIEVSPGVFEDEYVFTQEGVAGAGGGGATWGSITGTLSSQADLQAALDAKQATITNSDDITQGSSNLFMAVAERTKLGGIATGAEVNTIESVTSGEPTGSDAVLNVVSLTQAEYNAGTPTATTFYIITDA